MNAWFQNFRIFFIAKSDTLRSNTPFLLNDDYQEVSIWPLNKPLKMAKWGFWFEHVIFLYKNAWFSSRQRRKKYFSLLPGFCTKMHDFFLKSWWPNSLEQCLDWGLGFQKLQQNVCNNLKQVPLEQFWFGFIDIATIIDIGLVH